LENLSVIPHLGYWWYSHRNLQDTHELYKVNGKGDLNPSSTIDRTLDRDRSVKGLKQEKMPAMNLSRSTAPSETMSDTASRIKTDLKDLAAPITDPTSTGVATAKRAAVDLKDTIKETTDNVMNKPLEEFGSRDTLKDKARDAKDYVKEKAYEAKEGLKDTMRSESPSRDAKEYVKDKAYEAKDSYRDAKSYVKDKAYDAKESMKDTMRSDSPMRDAKEYVKDKAYDAKESAKDSYRDTKSYVKDKAYDAKESMKDTMRSNSPARDAKEYVKDKAYDAKESAKDSWRDSKDYVKDKAYDAKESMKDASYTASDRVHDAARHMKETGSKDRLIGEVDKFANMPSDVKDRVLARETENWHSVSGTMPDNLRSSTDAKTTTHHQAAAKARYEAEKDRAVMRDSSRGMTERAKAAGDFVVEKASEMYHEPFSTSKKAPSN
jgi:hypothetical protein